MTIKPKPIINDEECPHEPGIDEYWQESFVISVWDTEREVYLIIRLGQMPNRSNGIAIFSASAWAPGFLYKNTLDSIPLQPSDRGDNFFSAGNGLCEYKYDGQIHWDIRDKDVSIHLCMNGEPHNTALAASSSPASDLMAKIHKQSVGTVTGYIKIKEQTIEINGAGWRDHSWGPRNWLDFRVHRGFIALLEEELIAYFYSVVLDNGEMNKNALIIKNDGAEVLEECQCISFIAEDGISLCGGILSFMLDSKKMVIEFQPVGGASISMLHGFACVDLLCKVTMGGKTGIGLCSLSMRPQGGDKKPYLFPSSPGYIENGLIEL